MGQNPTVEKKFRFLTYGLLMPGGPDVAAHNLISKKWGIEYHWVAGCVVDEKLRDSVVVENKKVDALLVAEYGKEWREQFNQEVKAETKRQYAVYAILDHTDFILRKKAEVGKEDHMLFYHLTPVPGTTQYDVLIEGWGKLDGKEEYLIYYKLLVDCETKSLQVLSDKPTKK